jgi:hypothetical protein
VYDDALIRPWFESAVECVPGLSLFDAHAHIGFNDPDGLRLSAPELIETMEALDARSMVTPLHEPGGYCAANDRVLEESERSAGRLVPFFRVDPHSMSLDDYVDEIGLPSGGAIRASLGLVSNFQDVERFIAFASRFTNLAEVPTDLPPRAGC